ncbi:MAG: hypothetical protein AAF916_09840, partial [Planctomycetota bacterium]
RVVFFHTSCVHPFGHSFNGWRKEGRCVMRVESLYIGATPYGEACAQVGQTDYQELALVECHAFIGQLRRQFGDEPPGCKFIIADNPHSGDPHSGGPHDLGTCHSVNVQYDVNDLDACDWAFMVDNDQPEFWDNQACQELGIVSAASAAGGGS